MSASYKLVYAFMLFCLIVFSIVVGYAIAEENRQKDIELERIEACQQTDDVARCLEILNLKDPADTT